MSSASHSGRGIAQRAVIAVACLLAVTGSSGVASAAADTSPQASAGGSDAVSLLVSRYAVAGGIDYSGLSGAKGLLASALAEIAEEPRSGLTREEAIAFWINAYNVVTLSLVIERYPGVESVMEVPGFFKEMTTVVAGERMTLDEIEHRALSFGDPRAHFALVCASAGCPTLRSEAYEATVLERQMDEQTRRYLADERRGAKLDRKRNELWLSAIFKWYSADFVATGADSEPANVSRVVEWMLPFLPAETARWIEERRPSVHFLDYDWQLNDRPR